MNNKISGIFSLGKVSGCQTKLTFHLEDAPPGQVFSYIDQMVEQLDVLYHTPIDVIEVSAKNTLTFTRQRLRSIKKQKEQSTTQ